MAHGSSLRIGLIEEAKPLEHNGRRCQRCKSLVAIR